MDASTEPGMSSSEAALLSATQSVNLGTSAAPQESFRLAQAPVNVKLPEFWSADPDLWFSQAEAAFRRTHVLDSHVRYDFVLMKLPEDVLISVRDVVRAVTDDTEDPYGLLKSRLVSSYAQTKWQLANKLLDVPDLGDQRPSALMDKMMSLLPAGEKPGILFQALYLRRLPLDMREHVGGRQFDTARQMAEYADLLWDARGGARADLYVVKEGARRGRQSSRSPRRSPGRRDKTPATRGFCRLHAKWGAKAFKCIPPCTFQESGNDQAAGGN
jgi:hypothetical protein